MGAVTWHLCEGFRAEPASHAKPFSSSPQVLSAFLVCSHPAWRTHSYTRPLTFVSISTASSQLFLPIVVFSWSSMGCSCPLWEGKWAEGLGWGSDCLHSKWLLTIFALGGGPCSLCGLS